MNQSSSGVINMELQELWGLSGGPFDAPLGHFQVGGLSRQWLQKTRNSLILRQHQWAVTGVM